jgi:hypothetical protein
MANMENIVNFISKALGPHYRVVSNEDEGRASWFASCADIAGCGAVVTLQQEPWRLIGSASVRVDFDAMVPPSWSDERDLLTIIGWATVRGWDVSHNGKPHNPEIKGGSEAELEPPIPPLEDPLWGLEVTPFGPAVRSEPVPSPKTPGLDALPVEEQDRWQEMSDWSYANNDSKCPTYKWDDGEFGPSPKFLGLTLVQWVAVAEKAPQVLDVFDLRVSVDRWHSNSV